MTDAIRSTFAPDAVTEEERLYFDMIDRAALAGENRVISNSKAEHAVYLIYTFFKTAQQQVRIYCGSLAPHHNNVWAYGDPEVCWAAVGFLARSTANRLDVLVEEPIDAASHPLVRTIMENRMEDRISVKRVSDSFTDFHFILRDRGALRIEWNKEKAEALVNFNDVDLGDKLKLIFDSMSAQSKSLLAAQA